MVSIDVVSQSIEKVRALRDYHQVPVCAVHAPCLLITQRVWGTDPWVKLERSAKMAKELDADVVVVHPPFRWQRDYATGFVDGIADLERRTGIAFAVENMYPWRATSRREMKVYQPGWDPSEEQYANTTIDLSHAATAKSDPVAMAERLGDRLRHVHMTDGSGSPKDEHLVPGHGNQPCGPFLELLANRGFEGHIVVEINTRKAGDREAREADLLEALAFSRLHFAPPPPGRVRHCPRDRTLEDGRGRGPALLTPARRSWERRGRCSRRVASRAPRCARSPPRPASTPRWCTTTSAARTTCSWPRCSCRSTRGWCWRPSSRVVSTARGSGCCGCSCRSGTTRRPGCRCSAWSVAWSTPRAGCCCAKGCSASSSGRSARRSGLDEPERRIAHVASQMIGLVMLRYVLEAEPLASMDTEVLVATYAPTLQRYLDGELPPVS